MSEGRDLYKVVSSRGGTDGMYKDFYDEISILMRQGWKCQGGIFVTKETHMSQDRRLVEIVYVQAMIRDGGKVIKA